MPLRSQSVPSVRPDLDEQQSASSPFLSTDHIGFEEPIEGHRDSHSIAELANELDSTTDYTHEGIQLEDHENVIGLEGRSNETEPGESSM
jgi:hypothetical protein